MKECEAIVNINLLLTPEAYANALLPSPCIRLSLLLGTALALSTEGPPTRRLTTKRLAT